MIHEARGVSLNRVRPRFSTGFSGRDVPIDLVVAQGQKAYPCGDDRLSSTLTARNWARVLGGRGLRIRGKGRWYEGSYVWDWWFFDGGLDGNLLVALFHDGTFVFEVWEAPLRSA